MWSHKFYVILSVVLFIFIVRAHSSQVSSTESQPFTSPCGVYLCSTTDAPVNATLNGECKEFRNECLLNIDNCLRTEKEEEGRWKTVKTCPKDCPDVCILIFAPVCAKDGFQYQTFSNTCFMGIHNCKNNANFVVHNEGECESRPEGY